MYRLNGQLIVSPSDLTDHVACRHLTRLELAVLERELERPENGDPHLALIAQKGIEHEAAQLAVLRDRGLELTEIEVEDNSEVGLRAAEDATLAAMAAGVDIVYQATFFDGRWRAHADFLRRVETPHGHWGWSYEVIDTKLACTAKPYHVLQLCAYCEQLERLQGCTPNQMYLLLGTGEEQAFRVKDYAAYYRRVRDGFLASLNVAEDTYPEPVEHCSVCDWNERCAAVRRRDDHLSLVANIRRDQIARLNGVRVTTVAALGGATDAARPARMASTTFDTLRNQASLQVASRDAEVPAIRFLEPAPDRGFALLPPPSEGDVFFDFEGDPFANQGGGLEYLFGWIVLGAGGGWTYASRWAHDRISERDAFVDFIDWLVDRRSLHPDLHVHHYAAYEPSALKRLAGNHGVREIELDDLLRNQVFVDLYRVVRQGMQIGLESYSLKEVEVFYLGGRKAAVRDAGGSIVEYERWLETQDDAILTEIAEYNREDCHSTRLLRDWLLDRRADAERELGAEMPWVPPELREPDERRRARTEANEARIAQLHAALPADPADDDRSQRAMRLLGDVLEYHARERRPAWWRIYERCGLTDDELVEDTEAIGGLELIEGPIADKQSEEFTFEFPVQEHRVSEGGVLDCARRAPAGYVVAIDEHDCTLVLRRGPSLRSAPLPTGIVGGIPYDTDAQEAALAAIADHVIAHGLDTEGDWAAAIQVLRREPPRIAGRAIGAPLQGATVTEEEIQRLAADLDRSYLFIQGPPGSGKTRNGARVVVSLLDRGWRVGIAANTHRAIQELLSEIEEVAYSTDVYLMGRYKIGDDPWTSPHGLVSTVRSNDACRDPAANLIAGTSWLFARSDMRGTLHTLLIDEAGQTALTNAIAMAGAAENLVLLGDPRQLPQVTQAVHPDGSGCSVLEHLLGGDTTVPPDRGLFLATTYRLHPEICRWVSEVSYDERLFSVPETEQQAILNVPGQEGAGLRFIGVDHSGNRLASVEEADVVAAAVDELLAGGRVRRQDGTVRTLEQRDILVVAPYNRQRAALQERLPVGVRVGTVDKFQGQQAPVVFFSMAASNGEEVPRGLEFLFSRNRLNVALSRAQCIATIVANPRLLDVECRTIEQISLANGLCRAYEAAAEGDDTTGR